MVTKKCRYVVPGQLVDQYAQIGYDKEVRCFYAKVWLTYRTVSIIQFEAVESNDLAKLKKRLDPVIQIDGLIYLKLQLEVDQA